MQKLAIVILVVVVVVVLTWQAADTGSSLGPSERGKTKVNEDQTQVGPC